MRLLLDEHVSGPRVGGALRAEGHDVLAVAEESTIQGTTDEALLRIAASDRRITVTHNVEHFIPILTDWGASGEHHAGCILVKGIDHSEIGGLLRGLRVLLERHPTQKEWLDLALWLTPGSAAERGS